MVKWHPFDEVKDCGVVERDRYSDDRGFFQETWNRKEWAKAGIPLPWGWAQENTSFSRQGVLRGFHLQSENPQGKLITCVYGKIMDVCLDLRPHSPTFMKMTRMILDGSEALSFYCPPGTAHAFLAMESSMVSYHCTQPYDQTVDGGINATSPELAMVWPPGEYFRSERDRSLPSLSEYLQCLPTKPPPA
jgi:dTDP-4-dehydrorhamnose 3,5-epimerase